jgi:hypothetical protein
MQRNHDKGNIHIFHTQYTPFYQMANHMPSTLPLCTLIIQGVSDRNPREKFPHLQCPVSAMKDSIEKKVGVMFLSGGRLGGFAAKQVVFSVEDKMSTVMCRVEQCTYPHQSLECVCGSVDKQPMTWEW